MGPQDPVPVLPHHSGQYLCHLAGSGCHNSQSGAVEEGQRGAGRAGRRSTMHCGGRAHPDTTCPQGSVSHRWDSAPTLHLGASFGKGLGAWLEAESGDAPCLDCQGYFFRGAEC